MKVLTNEWESEATLRPERPDSSLGSGSNPDPNAYKQHPSAWTIAKPQLGTTTDERNQNQWLASEPLDRMFVLPAWLAGARSLRSWQSWSVFKPHTCGMTIDPVSGEQTAGMGGDTTTSLPLSAPINYARMHNMCSQECRAGDDCLFEYSKSSSWVQEHRPGEPSWTLTHSYPPC